MDRSRGGGDPRIEFMDLEAIRRAPRNPKGHDLERIGGSFDRFGFVAPPMLDEATGRLVAGHGRLDALVARKRAGGQPPARVRVTTTSAVTTRKMPARWTSQRPVHGSIPAILRILSSVSAKRAGSMKDTMS